MVSIGGLVGERLGRLPRKGDTVDFEGYRFRVAAASPRRAERIEIVSVPPPSAAGDAEPPASDPR
jgi:magnesium and cobalt transporter